MKKIIFRLLSILNTHFIEKKADCYFLMIGQSNMAGRGILNKNEDDLGEDRVLLFKYKERKWSGLKDPLQPMDDPIFSVKADKQSGVGPCATFGKTMTRKLGMQVGILLCARGGIGITGWQRNGKLFQETIKRALLISRSVPLKGICIFLGESDTYSIEEATQYPSRFINLVENLRNELGNNLPIIHAQLATVSEARVNKKDHGYMAWDFLKKLQENIFIDNCKMVKTEDLNLNDDGIHLSTKAQRILGTRLAKRMSELLCENKK